MLSSCFIFWNVCSYFFLHSDALHTSQEITEWELVSSAGLSALTGAELSLWPRPKVDAFMVTTPTTVLAALEKAGVYDVHSIYQNKFLDTIDAAQFDVPWYFSTCVNSTSSSSYQFLEFEGINYRADAWVNGVQIATSDEFVGTFRHFEFDITNIPPLSQVRQDETIPEYCISIGINRAVDDYWTRNATDLAISVVDWSPDAPDRGMGLIQPVTLHMDDGVRLRHPTAFIKTMTDEMIEISILVRVENHLKNSNVNGILDVELTLKTDGINDIDDENVVHCSMDIELGIGQVEDIEFNSSCCNGLSLDANNIDQSEILWWPYQMGKPNLQQLNITLSSSSSASSSTNNDSIKFDEINLNIGLRYLIANLDQNNNRLFEINLKKILIRGGGYAQDLLLKSSIQRYKLELLHIINLGLNMIRFEGKFPNEELFDLMDFYGILALPGICCCDAWQNWDLWPQNNYLISESSIESQLLKLRKHPSMAGFLLSSDELPPIEIEELYRNACSNVKWFNPIIAAAAGGVSVFNNESTGVKMLGPYAWVPPNYWSDPMALALYGGPIGFSTEISPGASPMMLNSWLKTTTTFVDTDDNDQQAWCPSEGGAFSDIWNYHCGNQHGVFSSLKYFVPSLQVRYGSLFLSNDTFLNEILDNKKCYNYEDIENGNILTNFLYLSQLATYESHRAMFEAYSNYKYSNATGVIQWMLNNGLPQHIWHLYDWFLQTGGAYYGTQRALEPLHASYDAYNGQIKVINSLYTEIETNTYELIVRIISISNGNSLLTKQYSLPQIDSDSVLYIDTLLLNMTFQYALNNGGTCLIRLDIQPIVEITSTNNELNEIHNIDDEHQQNMFNKNDNRWIDKHGNVIQASKPNTYWISSQPDVVNWEQCNFYVCNISSGNNFTSLFQLLPKKSSISTNVINSECSSVFNLIEKDEKTQLFQPFHSSSLSSSNVTCFEINITNTASDSIAFFIELELVGISGVEFDDWDNESKVSFFDDNFITLLPLETRIINIKVFGNISETILNNPKVIARTHNGVIKS